MPHAHVDGVDIAYETFGEGLPLVLVMGLGAQMIHWPDAFCASLAERGFRVVRFDNRDVGASSRLSHAGRPRLERVLARALLGLPVTAPYTLSDMARDTLGVMDDLDLDRAHVVGASMGGMIAQMLAVEHPDRVASLTAIMSSAGGRRATVGHPRAIRALLSPAPRTREQHVEGAVRLFRAIGSPVHPLEEDALRELAGRAWDRGVDPDGFARQLTAIFASGRRHRALSRLRVPALVLHGTHDPLIPARAGRALARAIPGARLRLVPGMGHDLPVASWPLLVEEITAHALRAAAR